jgi:PAS domain S-box-containing protein
MSNEVKTYQELLKEIEFLHSIIFDITDRKQAEIFLKESEARLSHAELVSKCGNWELHLDSQMIVASAGAEKIYGLHGTQFAFKTIKNARLPEDSSKMDTSLKNLIEKGEPYDIEYRIKNAESGKIIYLHSVAEYNNEKRIIFGIVQDISEQKQVEEKLMVALKEKEILLRELYHRTKNNMQVIYSLLALKGAAFEDKAIKEILTDVGNRIQAIALVHEKLYQSKNLSRIDLKDYITDLTSLLMESYNSAERNIELFLELESINVLIDTAIPCGQIIIELISNSFKHAFPDGRYGKIYIRLSRNKNDLIRLIISDNGIGIPDFSDIMGLQTLGMQLFKNITEHQLQGDISYNMKSGVSWTIRFKDILYNERVTC